MKKYLVDVFFPSIGNHYNVYLPSSRKVREVTQLLVQLASSLTDGGYQATTPMLLWAVNGSRLDPDLTVEEAEIRNSSHLILV